ncbi:glycosyltransferase [Microbacterium tenebrionis]|uniref:glycosyltransferase n=1 Tax=Microbacterium tenebrionis TaxID=2830665 RepID=UPI00158992FF|nr:glycosyltransferase [Microbacterium ihumii]
MKPNLPTAWAVFTTFRPGAEAEDAVASVSAQVDGVIVVDDGSGPVADAALDRLAASGVTVHRQHVNSGIAGALNTGIRLARESGAEVVITFDQDSLVPAGFVDALRTAYDAASADDVRVGVIVPEYFAAVRQARGAIATYGPAANVIQSGMLLPLDVVDRIGELRADYFIDLVDTEFELRLRREGYAVLAAAGLRLGHALGTQYRRELFGRAVRLPGIPPEITLSTPFRYFYRVRNRIVLNREYLWAAPVQILRDTLLDGIHFVNALGVARPRRALWRLYRAAINAAIRGRMGRMPDALQPVADSIIWDASVLEREHT